MTNTNGRAQRSQGAPIPEKQSISGRLSRPTYRVVLVHTRTADEFDRLEGEIRKRNWYELDHVTQNADGSAYTLFFRLKDEFRESMRKDIPYDTQSEWQETP